LPDDISFTVDAPATIVDEVNGSVKYTWAANDLSHPGTYQGRWEITYPGGKVVTTAYQEIVVVRQ